MSFPSSPSDGQTAILNGITYAYTSSNNTWRRVVSDTGVVSAFTAANTADEKATSAGLYANGAFTTANNALPKSGGTITGNVIFSGTNANLHFSGAAARITSDFSNATIASRTMFQTSTTDGVTNIYAIPNGSGAVSTFSAVNNSNPTNAGIIQLAATSTDTRVMSTASGSGTFLPLAFYTGGSERFRIDTSGNANIPGTLIIQSTTASTSNTTGAFEVIGGVGIQGNLYTGAITVTGPASNGITFADGTTQYTANVLDSWVRGTTNASFLTANSGASFANAAFDRANAAYNTANTGGGGGSDAWARDTANAAFITANAAFLQANSGGGGGGTTDAYARDTANASYTAQNTTAGFANSAYAHANAAYLAANTGGGGGADTWARAQANAAFLKANTEILILAVVDETTNVTVSSARASFRAPSAMTLTSIPRASLNVASSSGLVTCDIKLNGTTVLGANKLSIDATEKTSTTAATPTTLATTAISDDAEITVDITDAGTGAKGLKITLYYTD